MKILIITEDHSDPRCSLSQLHILKHLNEKHGFNALCLEYTQEIGTVSGLIATLRNTLIVIDSQYFEPFLKHLQTKKYPISKEQLICMDVINISKLIHDSKFFGDNEVTATRAICSYANTWFKLQIVLTLKNKLTIRCFDNNPKNDITSSNFAQREACMFDNMKTLASNGKVLVILGRIHMQGICEKLAEHDLLQQTIFFHLHSEVSAKNEEILSEKTKTSIYKPRAGLTAKKVIITGTDFQGAINQIDTEIAKFTAPFKLEGRFAIPSSTLRLWMKTRQQSEDKKQDLTAAVAEIEYLRQALKIRA